MKKVLNVILLFFVFTLIGCSNNEEFIVKYISNGQQVQQETVEKGKKANPKEISLNGFTFDGWFYDKDYSKKYLSEPITKATTFYAKWTELKYNVNYYSNNEKVKTETVEPGDILLPDELVRNGYKFGGWYYDEAFTSEYLFEAINEETNLYAKWIANEYEIRFFPNGGTGVPVTKVKHGDLLSKPTDPTKNRYVFKGWFLESGLVTQYDFNIPVSNEFSLYAKWEEEVIPLVDSDDFDAYYIVTSFGFDSSTSVNINYHTKNIKTSVEYTTLDDTDYTNKKTTTGEMEGFEALENVEKAFERRNVVRVSLTNLTPNTKYKYRINKGNDTYTEDYYFQTSGGSDTTSFIFMTDVHYYDGFDGAEISEEVIKKAMNIQPNIDFILQTGDIVDTGGNSDDWDKLFKFGVNSFRNLPYHNAPGNHEHYNIGPYSGPYRNKIYSSYYNYPANGQGEYLKTSHYFIHNDTLFIQVDTDLPYNQGQQLEWLDSVITNNPTKFVIVGTHAPVNEAGNDYNRAFMNIMEKHSVDLVIAGHYHSDSFKTTYLDQKPLNNNIGVTYLRGEGGGIKAAGTADPLDFAMGYIIDVLDDKIQVRKINARGDILSTRETANKKLHEQQPATKQELMDSIKAEYSYKDEVIMFTWSEKFFKNVKELVITENYRDQRTMSFIIPTPGYTYHLFDKFKDRYDHSYTFKVTFSDGSTEEKTFDYKSIFGMDLKQSDLTTDSVKITYALPHEEEKDMIKTYEVYINGVLYKTYNSKNSNNELVNYVNVTGLVTNTEYNITIKTYSRIGFVYSDTITIKTN